MDLSAGQIRAARALLDWNQARLAEATKLSVLTIRRMEGDRGPARSTAANVDAVRRVLEEAGVILQAAGEAPPGGPGVRLRT